MCKVLVLVLALAAAVPAAAADRFKFNAEVAAEGRWFFHDAAFPQQEGSGVSLAARPEFYAEWANGASSIVFAPFARWDQHDDERTHADIRELFWHGRHGDFELRAGLRTVFWGVTESVHLVNIINQDDLVENPDGEDKLGQPMLNLSWVSPVGDFEFFVLPYFRERTLPGPEGRLRAPIPFDNDSARYESDEEEKHIDGAIRWRRTFGDLDLGLSHFSGTARAPRFEPEMRASGPVLVPVYDLVERSGLDASLVSNAWLWKLELVHQEGRGGHFTAAAGGFEYTFTGIADSPYDLGVLMEGLWDDRGNDSPSPFQKDLFVGTRLAANDVAGSELLAGAIVDLDHGTVFGNVEASRRMGESAKLILELRLFERVTMDDPLFGAAEDDYLQLEFVQYF